MAAAGSSMYIISPHPMLGCVLEIIAVENLIRVTEALFLISIQRLSGFDQPLAMDIGVEESQECLPVLKVDRPCIGGDLIEGSDSSKTVLCKSSPTTFEGEECKDAGSDDDEGDDDDNDDDEDDDDEDDVAGDEEDDLSGDEGGQGEGDQENNPEDEEGDEEANGNDEDDDDDDDDEEEDDDDDEEEDDDEEDEEPPAKKKK